MNSGFSMGVFDRFSEQSEKYDGHSVYKLWNDFDRNPMERIQWGTIMYYVKMSDPEYFKKLNLKSVNQVSEC